MKNKKVNFKKLIFFAIIIIWILITIANNQGGSVWTDIKWGYMPSTEYYELKLAATRSEVLGSGKGTLSLTSFNTLGRDVKKAKGKWFKNTNVNFRAKTFEGTTGEMVTLTDGIHVAIFMFTSGDNYVQYTFADEDFLEYLGMTDYNLLGGYKITINK